MKLAFIKNETEFKAKLLLYLSVVLGVIILIKLGGLLVTSVRASVLMNKAVAQSKLDPNETKKYFSKSNELAGELKKNNLFAPEKPKEHPGKRLSGILGQEALINGKWYKIGDKIEDAEILAIEPTQVKFRWKGEDKYFAPIGEVSKIEPNEKKQKPPDGNGQDKNIANKKVEDPKAETLVPQEDDPLAWLGVKLSDRVRAKMLEKWNSLSDEEKEKIKEQWNSLPDEQKQQAADAWEQHL